MRVVVVSLVPSRADRCSTALEQQGYSCVLTTCSNETTAMNLYQAQYIISVSLYLAPHPVIALIST